MSLIDLKKRTHKTYDQYKIVKLLRTRLFELNSVEDKDEIINPIYGGDVLTLEFENWVNKIFKYSKITIDICNHQLCEL